MRPRSRAASTQIRREIEDAYSDWDREKLQERLAKLSGGVAIIRVGAATEVELKEKKHRIEDAVSATQAAIEEGIVAGGGTALIRARGRVDKIKNEGDEATGTAIVRKALRGAAEVDRPQRRPRGAGHRSRQVERETGAIGLNAVTGEFEDLIKAGIIDPAKVDPFGPAERGVGGRHDAHHRDPRGLHTRHRASDDRPPHRQEDPPRPEADLDRLAGGASSPSRRGRLRLSA